MRNQYTNFIDNLSIKLNNKIKKDIVSIQDWDFTASDRDPIQRRNGISNFGAFQMLNIIEENFATFGYGENRKVGR